MQLGRILAFGALGAALSTTLACGSAVNVEAGSASGDGGGGAASSSSASTTAASSTTASGAGGGTAQTTSASAGAGPSASASTGAGGASPFCADTCAGLYEASCFTEETCAEYCDARAASWPDDVRDAFAKCMAGNPLCFETIEGCMLGFLHPAGSIQTITASGDGLQAYDGKTLRIWHDPDAPAPFGGEAVIANGQFAFEWHEPVAVFDTGGPLLLMYIDMDGDGACDAAADVTDAEDGVWNGDLIDPVFSVHVTGPLADPDFVCDFPP